jgi:hypothetical protein
MRTTVNVALWLTRITGVIQVILGLLFWTGNAIALVQVHILSGLVLVIALWVLAVLAIQSGASPRQGVGALVWGLLVVALGMTQQQILPGPAHWLVQVVHLLIGLGAVGQAQGLANSLSRRQTVRI